MFNQWLFTTLAFSFLCVISSLAQSNKVGACPCCKAEFRQFDFWIGDWNTFTPGDTLVGTNRIVVLQDSCTIQENWASADGAYTGTSYNYYNPQTEKWHQTWIDNQGGSLLLSGGLENGEMVLYSETMKSRKGEDYINRITWTSNDDGTIRQHWEISSNDSEEWRTLFDGLYKRR